MESMFSLPKEGGLIADGVPRDILRRYEKIHTSIFSNESQGAKYIAEMVVQAIRQHYESRPFVLGLTTGRSPVGVYRELVRMYQAGKVSFREVEVYSLDEFYPIAFSHQRSRNFRIREEFINQVDILPENVHLLDGTTPVLQVDSYCAMYEAAIEDMDLLLLSIGEQGQMGFNEPGSYDKSVTRLVQLSNQSRKIQTDLFGDNVPKMAVTMGVQTIMRASKIVVMAWGEDKSEVIRKIVEGDVNKLVPASYLQNHANVEVVVDENAARQLTREQTPWLVGPCDWTARLVRKAVVWLCQTVGKPILKLTNEDYVENSLIDLLEATGLSFDKINIKVFNNIQHTITGWPGGKPDADDSTRPVPSVPFPKRVVIFSPHPDDDVISMGGTFYRLVQQGHDVHVAYETSGNVAVHDDVVLQMVDISSEMGFGADYGRIQSLISQKVKGDPEPRELLDIKAAIRRGEARAACRTFGLNDRTNAHFLNLPFYETGGIKKGELTDVDIERIVCLLQEIRPHQIYAAGDLSDPHGTHRVCIEAVLRAMERLKDEAWMQSCHLWLYRGAWQEWNIEAVDMAVPLSPDEIIKKRHAIFKHLSQKDIVPFPGADKREFWQRAEDRTQNTAKLYDKIGMPEYQSIELFVKMK